MPTAETVRWNLVVPKQLDKDLRKFLANGGGGKKGDLSRFVSEAVSKQIFDAALKSAHEHNADVPFEEIESIVEESLAWARARMAKR